MEKVRRYFKTEPLTAVTICLVSIFLLSLGIALLVADAQPEPKVYRFQNDILPLEVWGYLFIASGLIKPLRLFFQQSPLVSTILHFAVISVVNVWGISWIVLTAIKPNYAPAAVAYVFINIVCISIPYFTTISLKLRGLSDGE